MGKGKDIVITVYGHKDAIDNFAVSLFDKQEPDDRYGYYGESNANVYCNALNKLKLEGESWVLAKIVSENAPCSLDAFYPVNFEIILRLHDRSLQRVLREVDSLELARALKGEKEIVKEKVLRNMSPRAALILKEDMELMEPRPIGIMDVRKSQERIVQIIHHLEQTGEIIIPTSKGDTVE
jgi:flagellar motor switch protein FliG